ncbi:MAG: hypothetical protein ACJAXK_000499 [Yoonia sp.]|jgi:hypothetical protein
MVEYQVGYDLNIYAHQLPQIPEWIERLNACDRMTYQVNPVVKFDVGLSGFCPIKVTVLGRWLFSSNKDYMSGFEMSLRRFDFESYFDLKRGDTESKKTKLMEEGFDLEHWGNFKFEIGISFKPYNRFEAELSFLTAAILTNELDGVCWDPQTGQKLKSRNVLSWATKEVELHRTTTKNQKLAEHPFEGWR